MLATGWFHNSNQMFVEVGAELSVVSLFFHSCVWLARSLNEVQTPMEFVILAVSFMT